MKKILAAFLSACMLLALFPVASLAATLADGRVLIYVSPDGNDGADGTEAAPFKSLTAARNAIRKMKAEGVSPEKGFVVYLRGGEHQMLEGLLLTEEDSGTEQAPVVYRSYPGEEAVLVGGASLAGSSFQPITDGKVKERIIETSARDKVLVADLHAMGFSDFGEPFWPGSYSYLMEGLTQPEVSSPELFVDGVVQTLARYPNDGYMTISEVVDAGANPRNWEPDKANDAAYVPEDERDPTDTFVIVPSDNRYLKWTTVPEDSALMFGYWAFDWADHTVPMKKVNASQGFLESSIPSWYSVVKGQRFYVFNLLEEIDVPGEYFLDRENGLLYLYPPKDLTVADVKFSLLEDDLIHIDGASYVQFEKLRMTAMRGGAVNMTSGSYNTVQDCEIDYTADYAVTLGKETRNCGVIGSYLHDVNGGVWISSGDQPTLTPGGAYVRNCVFERFDRITKTYCGAVQLNGVGNIVEHNEMFDAVHLAIQFSGNNHLIQYNDIHDVLKEADDMSAIYSGRSWVDRGTKICYNYIHDLVTNSGGGTGIFGVYLDDRLSGIDVIGNIFEDIPKGHAYFGNGGRENSFYNNILVNIQKRYRIECLAVGSFSDMTNLMNSLEKVPYQSDLWKEAYPELYNILNEDPNYPNNFYCGNNLVVNCGPKLVAGGVGVDGIHEENVKRGVFTDDYDAKSVKFLDAENGIYLLPEDSIVFEKLPDFKQLPVTRMGTYSDRALSRVRKAVTMAVGSPSVLSHGEETAVDTENPLVVPIIQDDRTFVPLRFLSEAFGMQVDFNAATSKITVSGGEIVLELFPGSTTVKKGGADMTIDAAPFITSEGRTLVPLRAVTEMLQKQVHWDERGLIIVSDTENIINPAADDYLVEYLYNYLVQY